MPTDSLEAYDLALRAGTQLRRTTRESNAEARRLFAKAVELDPGFAGAYAGWAGFTCRVGSFY